MKILMVCLGNICRSPLAEGILQHKADKAGLGWQIDSAGTESYHVGQPPHRFSQKVALQHGINISKQRARKFVPEDLERFDKIYAMAPDILEEMKWITRGMNLPVTKTGLLLNELNPGKNQPVPDPYYGGESGFHEVYDLLNTACDAVIEKYRAGF
jgi:protein-tyrosine phosphatase